MMPETFHDIALGLPGATFDVKWGIDRVYSVGARMFATAGPLGDPTPRYGFKASDLAFVILVEQGVARPAPYLACAKGVQLTSADALSDGDLAADLREAHRLVAGRLTRAMRARLGFSE